MELRIFKSLEKERHYEEIQIQQVVLRCYMMIRTFRIGDTMTIFDILVLIFFGTLIFSYFVKSVVDLYIYVVKKLRENEKR